MSEKVIPSVGDEHENDLEKDVTADVPISREFVARVTSIKIMKPGLASSLVKEEPKAKEIDATVEHSKYLTHLPRGGTIVATPQGDIQFGIPPETIKDSMKLGITVPTYFVILGEMFDRQAGLNMAEFEFPAYFNFFCLKKKVTLICMPDMEPRVRAIFTETLLGPTAANCKGEADHAPSMNSSAYPNFREEGYYLDSMRRELNVNTLVDFLTFDARFEILLGDEENDPENVIRIKYDVFTKSFRVVGAKNVELAKIVEKFTYVKSKSLSGGSTIPTSYEPTPFHLPRFGVTILGSSHGFDPNGNTTGFVIWVNGRGIMVDPPPGSSQALEKLSIPPRFIEGIILTHCHADHDAGTFQKILKEQSVKIYTTTTIFDSFMRKYSAISGFDSSFLNSLFTFKPVKIGEPVEFHGAKFNFYYSFHTIPTVGFDVHLGTESLVYSADTNSSPEVIETMFNEGAIGKQRRDMLIGNSPLVGDHNLIFHEAGVPPIHTPMNLLVDLDDKVKERLFVVHVTGSQIPADSGLKQANEWDTMEIEVDDGKGEVDEFGRLLESLTLLTDNFSFTTETFKVLSENAEKKVWERGTTIMEKDATIEHLFVFTSGIALEQTEEGEMNRTYKPGDYTGENAFVGDGAKTMFKITAGTKVHAVQVPIAVIKPFLNNEKTLKEIAAVAALQSDGTWTSTSHNMILQTFTNFQKKDFLNCLEETSEIYHAGDPIDLSCCGVLVVQGEVQVLLDPASVNDEEDLSTYRGKNRGVDFIDTKCAPGSFLSDINAVLNDRGTHLSCEALSTVVKIRRLPRGKMIDFLVKNPGLMVQLLDTRILSLEEVL